MVNLNVPIEDVTVVTKNTMYAYEITGLHPYTEYSIALRANNSHGLSHSFTEGFLTEPAGEALQA